MSFVRICDRCGRRMEIFGPAFKVDDEDHDGQDFCASCIVELAKELTEEPKEEEPPKKEKKPRKQKPQVDHGRQPKRLTLDVPGMVALRRAGWSVAQIAVEHGVSEPTVRKHLGQALGKEVEDEDKTDD